MDSFKIHLADHPQRDQQWSGTSTCDTLHRTTAEQTKSRLNIKTVFPRYGDSHVKDYKNPLHLDVVDRYLRRMGDKAIPDEAPPSLESFYPPWVAGIDLPQSRCCGFFVSFTIKVYFKVKTQGHRCFVDCLTVVIHIRKWRLIACVVMVTPWRLFAMQNNKCHQLRLKPYSYIQKYQTQLCICRSTTSVCQEFCVVCVYMHINSD